MPTYELTISTQRDMLLRELYQRRGALGLSFHDFLLELLEVPHLTDLRLEKRAKKLLESSSIENVFQAPIEVPRRQPATANPIIQKKIVALRREMSTTDVAKRLGLSESSIRRILRGHRRTSRG